MNKVKILFFATLKEKAGTTHANLEIPAETSVAELKERLFKEFPNLPKSRANLIVAINKEYAFDTDTVPVDAEIALFPPVSGG